MDGSLNRTDEKILTASCTSSGHHHCALSLNADNS